jgi:hypothetical protein
MSRVPISSDWKPRRAARRSLRARFNIVESLCVGLGPLPRGRTADGRANSFLVPAHSRRRTASLRSPMARTQSQLRRSGSRDRHCDRCFSSCARKRPHRASSTSVASNTAGHRRAKRRRPSSGYDSGGGAAQAKNVSLGCRLTIFRRRAFFYLHFGKSRIDANLPCSVRASTRDAWLTEQGWRTAGVANVTTCDVAAGLR